MPKKRAAQQTSDDADAAASETLGCSVDKDRGIGEYSYLRTFWVALMATIWCPLTGIPAMLVILLTPFLGLSKCQRLCWRCSTIFFKIVLWSSGCAYTVEGLEQLEPGGNYFFACNHESLWDVPLVFAALPFWLISIAKKSLRMVPVFGWAVAAGGTVWIDRKNHAADMKSMKVAEESLRKRPRSVLIFPEGTRTADGKLQAFKKGGFVLAIQASMPVVPLCVCGTYDVVVKGGRKIRPRALKLFVGKPIATDKMSYDDRDALTDECKACIAGMKQQWRDSEYKCDNLRVEPFWHCFVPTPSSSLATWWGRVASMRSGSYGKARAPT